MVSYPFPMFCEFNADFFTLGKYVGNRPIRLSKVQDDKYGSIATTQVSGRKVSWSSICTVHRIEADHVQARELDKLRKNRGKPLDGRPVPY